MHLMWHTSTWHDASARERVWQSIRLSQAEHAWAYPAQGFSYLRQDVRYPKYGLWRFEWSAKRNSTLVALSTSELDVVFPHWPVVALTSICPAVWMAPLIRRWKRRRNGLCLHCGYDLRASNDRCPECGSPTAHSKIEIQKSKIP